MKKAKITLHIMVEKDPESGWLVASCPELPGCVTQAETEKELRKNVEEAVTLWFAAQHEKTENQQCMVPAHNVDVRELALSF